MNKSITGYEYLRTIINKSNQQTLSSLVCCAALLSSTQVSGGQSYRYTVEVDADLGKLHVTAQFDEAVDSIAARSASADQFLISTRDCDGGAAIEANGRRMLFASGVECLHYTIDLHAAAQTERHNQSLHPASIVVSPTVWMWRPRLGGDDEIIVQFNLPEGIGVSVPWQPIDANSDTYRLTSSPQSGAAISIFGRFTSASLRLAGTDLRVAMLWPENDVGSAAIVDWIRSTAYNVMQSYGRFPNPYARIVVIPSGDAASRSDKPVRFGRVVRDGGETIELLIDRNQPMETFYDDWTATHEFSHLMLPYVRHDQRWISEGFAQYYQNILLTRAGRYNERYAWQKIVDGLERGRLSVPHLSPNEAARNNSRDARMKIYWGGAALALMADVELRRRSDGKESLDFVLDQIQRCCLPSQRTWTGEELFTQLDSFLDTPVFMPLYRQYADAQGFPDTSPLLQRLGVIAEGGEVRLDATAEMAKICAALTAQIYTGESDN